MKNDMMTNYLKTYIVNVDVNRGALFSDFAYNRINLFSISQVTAISPGLSALGSERLDEAVQFHLV